MPDHAPAVAEHGGILAFNDVLMTKPTPTPQLLLDQATLVISESRKTADFTKT